MSEWSNKNIKTKSDLVLKMAQLFTISSFKKAIKGQLYNWEVFVCMTLTLFCVALLFVECLWMIFDVESKTGKRHLQEVILMPCYLFIGICLFRCAGNLDGSMKAFLSHLCKYVCYIWAVLSIFVGLNGVEGLFL